MIEPEPDLLSIDNLRNRYETYRRLRASSPAMAMELNGEPVVVVTRFEDVDALFKHPKALVQPSVGEFPNYIGSGSASVFYRLSLPHMDPPEHGQYRRILMSAFNARAVARLQDMVSAIIESALDAIGPQGPVEVASSLSARIPADVACGMLHVPPGRAADLFGRVDALSVIVSQSSLSEETLGKANEAAQFYFDFFDELVESNRTLPEDDLVATLIQAEKDGLWSREALATTLMGLFIASFHTTRTAISNALHAFATNQEQYRAMTKNPSLAAPAWEECLRFDSPVHFVHRYATAPMSVAGRDIAPRTRLLLGLASANRDESHYADPDRFDIARPPSRHLAFAFGAHFCAGAQLSRLEGKLLFNGLTQRWSAIHLTSAPIKRNHDLTFPFIEEMTLDFEAIA